MKLSCIQCTKQEDTYTYNLDELKAIVEEKQPRLLLVASPNNPTGNGLTGEEIEQNPFVCAF